MQHFSKLSIYQKARTIVQAIGRITANDTGFGDLNSQLRRAAVSIASNIAEGAGSGSDRGFRRHLALARASLHEVEAQLQLLADIRCQESDPVLADELDHLGRMITKFMKTLTGSADR